MNRDDTARMAGPNFARAGDGKDRNTRHIAIGSLLIAIIAAGFTGWNALSSHQRNEQAIKDKAFAVQVDRNWEIHITQIGGPLYQIATVKLTPTFQDPRGSFVDGEPIEIPLGDLQSVTENGTHYVIDDPHQRVCPPNRNQPKLKTKCIDTALARLKINFDVLGNPRTYVCRPGQCA